MDNRDSRFRSAATALNWGAERASGEWILFAHQDISLLAEDWLSRAEKILQRQASAGWYGVVGYTASGRLRGIILDRAALSGEPFDAPAEVQTLDECLLMHRREPGRRAYFDEGVPGWHAYGVEACCAAIRAGANNYVLPLPVWHDSKSTNLRGLEEAHRYVWEKHGHALKLISTTCGNLPGFYGWEGEPWQDSLKRAFRRIQASYYHRLGGHPGAFHHNSGEVLESLTEAEELIECLHKPAWYGPIEARAFVVRPRRSRRIIHRFSGCEVKALESDCVVVAADLAGDPRADLQSLQPLFGRARRVLACVEWGAAMARSGHWKALKRQASEVHLTQQWDGTRVAVLELLARAAGGERGGTP